MFFRAMRRAEFDDIHETGRFRVAEGMCMGKYLATSLADALAWARKFRERGWESQQVVVRLTVPVEDARQFTLIGERIDEIGPAYYAELDYLQRATIDTEHIHEA